MDQIKLYEQLFIKAMNGGEKALNEKELAMIYELKEELDGNLNLNTAIIEKLVKLNDKLIELQEATIKTQKELRKTYPNKNKIIASYFKFDIYMDKYKHPIFSSNFSFKEDIPINLSLDWTFFVPDKFESLKKIKNMCYIFWCVWRSTYLTLNEIQAITKIKITLVPEIEIEVSIA
jgi:hypothetical protein